MIKCPDFFKIKKEMKNLQKFAYEREFESRKFIFQNGPEMGDALFNRDKRKLNKLNREINADLNMDNDDYEIKKNELEGLDLATNTALSGEILKPISELRDLEKELNKAKQDKDSYAIFYGHKDKRKIKRTTKKTARELINDIKEKRTEIEPLLQSFKGNFDTEYKKVIRKDKEIAKKLKDLQVEKHDRQEKMEFTKQIFDQYNKKVKSKKNVSKFKTQINSARNLYTSAKKSYEIIDVSIKNTQKLKDSSQNILDNYKIIDHFVKSPKELEPNEFLKLFKSNKLKKSGEVVSDFLTKNAKLVGQAEAKKIIRTELNQVKLNDQGDTKITLNKKVNELLEKQKELAKAKNSRFAETEAGIEDIENIETEIEEKEAEISEMNAKYEDETRKIIENKYESLETLSDNFSPIQEVTMKSIDELIEKKEKNLHEKEKDNDGSLLEIELQELSDLKTQKEFIENGKPVDENIAEGEQFKVYNKEIKKILESQSLVDSLQSELQKKGITDLNYNTNSLKNFNTISRNTNLSTPEQSRIEKKVSQEFDTKFGTDLESLINAKKDLENAKNILITLEKKDELYKGKNEKIITDIEKQQNDIAKKEDVYQQSIKELSEKLEEFKIEKQSKLFEQENEISGLKLELDLTDKVSEKNAINRKIEKAEKELAKLQVGQEAFDTVSNKKFEKFADELIENSRENFSAEVNKAIDKYVKSKEFESLQNNLIDLQSAELDLKYATTAQEKVDARSKIRKLKMDQKALLVQLRTIKNGILASRAKDELVINKELAKAKLAKNKDTAIGKLNIQKIAKKLKKHCEETSIIKREIEKNEKTLTGQIANCKNFSGTSQYAYDNLKTYCKTSEERHLPTVKEKIECDKETRETLKNYKIPAEAESFNPTGRLSASEVNDTYNNFAKQAINNFPHMIAPVQKGDNSNVVAIRPYNSFDGKMNGQESPNGTLYYEITENGTFKFICAENYHTKLGFKLEMTNNQMTEHLSNLDTKFESKKDALEKDNYFDQLASRDFKGAQMLEKYSNKLDMKIDKRNSTVTLSINETPNSEFHLERVKLKYNSETKTWKVDKRGLSEVELDEIESRKIDIDEEISRRDFGDILNKLAKTTRLKKEEEGPGFWTTFATNPAKALRRWWNSW